MVYIHNQLWPMRHNNNIISQTKLKLGRSVSYIYGLGCSSTAIICCCSVPGMIYLPEIKYRRILNQAFGPGGWAIMPRGETLNFQVLCFVYQGGGSAGPNVCGYVCSVRWQRELSWSQGSMPCTVKVGLWHRPQENTRSTAKAISAMARRVNQPSPMLSWGAAKTWVLPVSSGIHRYTTLHCWVWAYDCALDFF